MGYVLNFCIFTLHFLTFTAGSFFYWGGFAPTVYYSCLLHTRPIAPVALLPKKPSALLYPYTILLISLYHSPVSYHSSVSLHLFPLFLQYSPVSLHYSSESLHHSPVSLHNSPVSLHNYTVSLHHYTVSLYTILMYP